MKNITILVLAGAILGAAAASVIVPPTLSWYNEAGFVNRGNQVQSLVNIPEVVRYTTSHLIRAQLIGAGIGAAVFLVLGIVAAVRASARSRRRASAAPAAPPGS